jgi:toxin ParE1/3/4
MKPAVFSPRALRELVAAAEWIAIDNPVAARALRESAIKAAALLGAHPELGPLRPDIASVPYRFLPLKGFPYVLVYNPEASPPLIVRVVHGARDLPEVLSDL